jgi:hypothetical protein
MLPQWLCISVWADGYPDRVLSGGEPSSEVTGI